MNKKQKRYETICDLSEMFLTTIRRKVTLPPSTRNGRSIPGSSQNMAEHWSKSMPTKARPERTLNERDGSDCFLMPKPDSSTSLLSPT